MRPEAKVGAVFLLCFALLVVGWVQLTGGIAALRTYRIGVHFTDLASLPRGAPVRLQGVEIGRVAKVGFSDAAGFRNKPATAWLSIENRYPLYRGDVFRVASASLMGDKYVEVTLGPRRVAILRNGDHVDGAEPRGLDALAKSAEDLTTKATTLIDNLNVFAGDPRMRDDLQVSLRNLRQMSEEGVRLGNDLSRFVAGLPNTRNLDLNRVRDILDNVYEASRTMRAAAAGVNALMATSTIPDDVQAAVASLRDAGASIERSAAHVEQTVTDPQLNADLRDTVGNLRTLTDRGIGTADRLDSLLTDTDRIVGRVQDGFTSIDRFTRNVDHALDEFEYEGYADLQVGTRDKWRADVNVDIYPKPNSDTFYRIGLRDVGDQESLNLQVGMPLGDRGDQRLRLGWIGGSLGAGWDKEWSARVGTEVDAHHPDRLQLDLRGKYHYNDDWDVLLGVDSLFDRNSVFVGARRNFDF